MFSSVETACGTRRARGSACVRRSNFRGSWRSSPLIGPVAVAFSSGCRRRARAAALHDRAGPGGDSSGPVLDAILAVRRRGVFWGTGPRQGKGLFHPLTIRLSFRAFRSARMRVPEAPTHWRVGRLPILQPRSRLCAGNLRLTSAGRLTNRGAPMKLFRTGGKPPCGTHACPACSRCLAAMLMPALSFASELDLDSRRSTPSQKLSSCTTASASRVSGHGVRPVDVQPGQEHACAQGDARRLTTIYETLQGVPLKQASHC